MEVYIRLTLLRPRGKRITIIQSHLMWQVGGARQTEVQAAGSERGVLDIRAKERPQYCLGRGAACFTWNMTLVYLPISYWAPMVNLRYNREQSPAFFGGDIPRSKEKRGRRIQAGAYGEDQAYRGNSLGHTYFARAGTGAWTVPCNDQSVPVLFAASSSTASEASYCCVP